MPARASPKEKCIESRNDLTCSEEDSGSQARTSGICRAAKTGRALLRSMAGRDEKGDAGLNAIVMGDAWAVKIAVEKKVMTATMDLRDSLDMPHSMCPLVHPDPSYQRRE